jgi:hypothetical protein
MTKEKRKPHGDYLIGFGKRIGRTFNQIRGTGYRYIVWLSGKVQMMDGTYQDVDVATAKQIGTKSELRVGRDDESEGPVCIHCIVQSDGEDDGVNQCDLAGETLEITISNMDRHLDSHLMKRRFGLYTAWKKVRDEHPDAVDAAQNYLAINHICYSCGRTTSVDIPLPLCKGHRESLVVK